MASLGALLPAGCSDDAPLERPRPQHPNVLLISLDSLRPDHLSCYGYKTRTGEPTSPNVDALAAAGALFEEAVSTTTWTLPSHHALMSGLPDLAHGVLSDGYGPTRSCVQLAQLLSDAGYATAGFYSGPYLGPSYGFGDGFDEWTNASGVEEQLVAEGAAAADGDKAGAADSDPAGQLAPRGLQQAATQVSGKVEQSYHVTASAKRVSDAGVHWLESRHEAARASSADKPAAPEHPFFLFLHYFDIHYDFVPPDEGHARAFWPNGERPRLNGDHFFESKEIHPGMARADLDGVITYYDGEIRWTDSQVGRVLERLERLGLERDTIVVIVSDHGDEFFDHGGKGHRQNLFESTLSMALVIRWPGMIEAGRRIEGRVSMVDVAPTLIDLCGVADRAAFYDEEIPGLATGDRLHGMWGRSLRNRLDGAPSDDRESIAFLANQWQDPERPIYHFALVTDRFKVIVSQSYLVQPQPNGQVAKLPGEIRGRVFDLRADPREQKDLSKSKELDVQRAIARYDANFTRSGRVGRWLEHVECGPQPPPITEVERKLLAELGYTELPDQRPPIAPGTKLEAITPRPPAFPKLR